jgi:hypothetical protein
MSINWGNFSPVMAILKHPSRIRGRPAAMTVVQRAASPSRFVGVLTAARRSRGDSGGIFR